MTNFSTSFNNLKIISSDVFRIIPESSKFKIKKKYTNARHTTSTFLRLVYFTYNSERNSLLSTSIFWFATNVTYERTSCSTQYFLINLTHNWHKKSKSKNKINSRQIYKVWSGSNQLDWLKITSCRRIINMMNNFRDWLQIKFSLLLAEIDWPLLMTLNSRNC